MSGGGGAMPARVIVLVVLAAAALGLRIAGLLSVGVAGAIALLCLGALVGIVVLASSHPELQWFGPAVLRAKDPGAAVLTFDDGPHPDSTPRILDALQARGARATFFVLADRAERWPELVRAMVAGGHEVALHGRAHHPWLTVWPPARGAADLRAGLAILEGLGVRTRWFRPPFGAVSPRVYAAAELAGLEVAWCSVRTGDGVAMADSRLLAVCREVVATDIVLLHEGEGRQAARLLPEILEEWASRGIRATTLSEGLGR